MPYQCALCKQRVDRDGFHDCRTPISFEWIESGPSCAFCGKNQREVKVLVAGVQACICDECIKAAAREAKAGTK